MTTKSITPNAFLKASLVAGVLSAGLPSQASAVILPDLTIIDARIEASNPSLLRVKVANVGKLAATETQLNLYIERESDTLFTSATVPLLKAGERQWMVVVVGFRPLPTDRVILRIDEPDQLDESDENNNLFDYQ